MADDLYDRDFFAWTQEQAKVLRARRGGANALDYDNLAEEIEDVGKSELHACESFLDRIIQHLIKIEFIGSPQDTPHWRSEVRTWRRDLGRRLTPTIERKLRAGLERAFADAVEGLESDGLLASAGAVFAARAPYSWDELTDGAWYPEPRQG